MAPRGWTTVCYSCWSENGNSKSSKLLLSWGITICVPFPQSDSPLGSTGDYWSYSTPFQVNCAWNEVRTLEHTFVWKVVIYFYLAGCWYLGNRKYSFLSLFFLTMQSWSCDYPTSICQYLKCIWSSLLLIYICNNIIGKTLVIAKHSCVY